jgi:hypothetical protein
MSIEEFDKTIPVRPPTVKRKIKPITHKRLTDILNLLPNIDLNHLNTLIPVGIAIIIVAEVKYERLSRSILTVNI